MLSVLFSMLLLLLLLLLLWLLLSIVVVVVVVVAAAIAVVVVVDFLVVIYHCCSSRYMFVGMSSKEKKHNTVYQYKYLIYTLWHYDKFIVSNIFHNVHTSNHSLLVAACLSLKNNNKNQ